MGIIKKAFSSKTAEKASGTVGFNALFNEYFDRLVYFSFQLVKDTDQARDIVQDIFVKCWQQQDELSKDKAAVKNFLYRAVRNASLNSIRHEKVVEVHKQLNSGKEPEEAPVIEAIIAAEVLASLHTAVQALPENYKLVSLLGYMEGKKNHEIADELNLSVNTIKKQKQKALQLLRLKLQPEIFVFLFFLTTVVYL